jgi:hypothetical protein
MFKRKMFYAIATVTLVTTTGVNWCSEGSGSNPQAPSTSVSVSQSTPVTSIVVPTTSAETELIIDNPDQLYQEFASEPEKAQAWYFCRTITV